MSATSIVAFTLATKKPREKGSKAKKLQETEKKLEEMMKELKAREERLEEKEREAKMRELKEREAAVIAAEQRMVERMERVGKAQSMEAEEMMNNTMKLWQMLHMNMASLLQFQNTMLEQQQQLQLITRPRDENSINLDELYNRLQYCIPMALQQIANGPIVQQPKITFNTQIFTGGNLLSQRHQNQLMGWLPEIKFTLVYKASRDGFNATKFHAHCDNKGPTLTVIQSKDGHLFGGFASLSWKSSVGYVAQDEASTKHTESFLFTLTNPHSLPSTRYPLKPYHAPRAIYCDPSHCVVFGENDIFISSGSNENETSFSNFPRCFVDSTGSGNRTFAGTRNFSTSEVEVYAAA